MRRAAWPATAWLAAVVVLPLSAAAQEPADTAHATPPSAGRGFQGADVSMGPIVVQDVEPGIGFTVGADVSNLFIRGFITRFAFRLWASEDLLGTETVEFNDFIVSVMQRLSIGEPGFNLYGGIGASLHFVSAPVLGTIDLTDPRDGIKPGLDLQFGLAFPIAEDGFIMMFAEGIGSLVPELSQATIQVGLRLRFDNLPEG